MFSPRIHPSFPVNYSRNLELFQSKVASPAPKQVSQARGVHLTCEREDVQRGHRLRSHPTHFQGGGTGHTAWCGSRENASLGSLAGGSGLDWQMICCPCGSATTFVLTQAHSYKVKGYSNWQLWSLPSSLA